ncbi:MAG: PAS domain S-box protein, partial [Acidobacteria bacterium]|nr:PAS domain S-box protein [Acidobacteriota bacterium]
TDLPVILLTALDDPISILRGLECGADNVLTKPCEPDDLLGRVKRIHENKRLRAQGQLQPKPGAQIGLLGKSFAIACDREQILDLFVSTFEDMVRTNRRLQASQAELEAAKARIAAYARQMEERARASQQRSLALMEHANDAIFRRLLEAAPDAMVIVGPDGRIELVNDSTEKLFGYRRDELLGKPVEMLVPERFRDVHGRHRAGHFGAPRQRTLGAGLDLFGRRKDGSEFPVEISLSPMETEEGMLVTAAIRDVTERKRAERRLAAQHAVTRILAEADSLAEAAPEILRAVCENLGWEAGALWTVDRAANVLRCADVWHVPAEKLQQFVTITRQSTFVPGVGLPGRVWSSREPVWVAQVSRDPKSPLARVISRTGLRSAFGFPILLGDQVYDVVEFFSGEIRQPDEELLRMVAAIGSQIGQFMERTRAEAALRETSEMLREVIQTSPLAIIALDLEGRVKSWNPGAERIFGWSESEVIGLPTPTIPENQRAEFRAMLEEQRQGAPRTAWEMRCLKKDGSLVDVSLWTAPLHDSKGAIMGSLGILADITERKQLEEQLRQSQKIEAIGQLAGGVAHDFNNLLTVITGYADLLLARVPPEDPRRKSLEEIRKAGERASALTRQLLAFGRKQILEPRVIDLNTIVVESDKLLRRLIGEHINVVTALDPRLGRVIADPGQIEQVILNLAVNARDAMPQGGKLTIETANVELDEAYARAHVSVRPGPHVMLAVSDTGCGMDKETLAQIFEPFFTTKEKGKGTGLGLATVYGIVKQSGGNIWVYTEPGQGAAFKVYLPRVEGEVELARPVTAGTRIPAGSETLLLAEDDELVRKLVRQTLEMYGYTVLEARQGAEALEICQRHEGPIHLIVTDVVMPEMSGRELAYRVSQLRPPMKVLYLSGYTGNAIVHHGVLEPSIPFLQKPFTPDALARKVREVLDAPQEE